MNNPPSTPQDYEFSLPRDSIVSGRPEFRWRLGDREWRCARIAGRAECIHADGETGRLYLHCRLMIENGIAFAYLDNEADLEAAAEAAADGVESHWRLCYAREVKAWRLRDERKDVYDPSSLVIVNEYKGVINLNWFDGGTHVFHDGKAKVDENGVCHFD